MTATTDDSVDWQNARKSILNSYSTWLSLNSRQDPDPASTIMDDVDQLPLAQRRTKRRCSVLSPQPVQTISQNNLPSHATPSRARSKRVRFSDPTLPTIRTPSTTSTGLTPFIHKASLTSTPRRHASNPTVSSCSADYEEVQFTPFRQILNERFKRQLRRHGLSDDMNGYEAEIKSKMKLQKEIEAKDEQLRKLKAELEAVKSSNAEEALASSQLVVDEVETELAQLRQSFSEHEAAQEAAVEIDWSHVRRSSGPGSEGGDTINIWEDDGDIADMPTRQDNADAVDSDLLAMAVDLEAARSEKDRLFSSSFRSQSSNSNGPDLHFADSPARLHVDPSTKPLPAPTKDFYHNLSKSLKETTRRAEDAELALAAFEAEIKNLGFDGETASGMLTGISSQLRNARLDLERLMPGETVTGFESAKVLPEIMTKLHELARQVREKDGELKSLREQERTLRGNFDHALAAGEKANQRVKALEHDVDVGAEDMLDIRIRSQKLEREGAEKDQTITRLITALGKYREDIESLEKLIERMEVDHLAKIRDVTADFEEKMGDLDARVVAEQTGRRAAESSAVERLAMIKDLELALSVAQQHSHDLESQLVNLKSQVDATVSQHSAQLDARNTRISNLSTALASANAEVDKLKALKAKLEVRNQIQEQKAAETVEGMWNNCLKNFALVSEQKKTYSRGAKVASANWQLENDDDADESSSVSGPMTPRSMSVVKFVDVEEENEDDHVEGNVELGRGRNRRSIAKGKGRARRRTDSGIGMSNLLEEDEETGLETPELSSEAEYETVE